MSRDSLIVLILCLLLGGGLTARYALNGATPGLGYYQVQGDGTKISIKMQEYQSLVDDLGEAEVQQRGFRFSWMRTFGIWIAAFFTLAMLSFLYKDNPLYKIAEHVFVGVSAAYWMVVAFWDTVVPNLLGELFPRWVKFNLRPGGDLDETVQRLATESWLQGILVDYAAADGDGLLASSLQLMNFWYWIPLALGIMLLWRLAPSGGWIARWPLAFVIGYTAGIRLPAHLGPDFVSQIQNTIIPLYAPVYHPSTGALMAGQTVYQSASNLLLVLGVLCGLVYFFFSLEHRGFVGRVSRLGVWVLMVTFGAGFGFTVMGRIALLVGRFEYLLDTWLNLR